MSSYVALSIVFLAAVAVQACLRFGLGRRAPWGDENEYLARARAQDPFGPEPFLRMPLITLFVLLAGRTEYAVRNGLAVLAVTTIMLVAGAGYVTGGPGVAIGCGLLFTLLPDRMILSQHIKPDALLSLWHSVLLLLLVCSAKDIAVPLWSYGLVSAAACLTRLDGAIIPGTLSFHPLFVESGSTALALLELWVLPVAALALITLRNARCYGIAMPDTTSYFNVTVLAHEHQLAPGASVPVEAVLMPVLFARWSGHSHEEHAAAFRASIHQIKGQPLRFLRGVLERTWQMLGRDTFITENLLDLRTGAYPEITLALRRAFARFLRASFPLLVALAAAGAVTEWQEDHFYVLIAAATLVGVSLIHTRTRFRYAILPELSFLAVGGLLALGRASPPWQAFAALLIVAVITMKAPPRRELL